MRPSQRARTQPTSPLNSTAHRRVVGRPMGRMGVIASCVVATVALLTGCGVRSETTSEPVAPPPSSAAACSPARTTIAGTTSQTITVDGVEREYLLNVPPGYNGSQPLPLVMTLHGRGGNASQQLLLTGFSSSSDVNNFILVAPSAINGNWDLPLTPGRATTDTTFIAEMIGQVESKLCVDSTRRYASGMSLGSAMTLALACAPNQSFAAFGGVGASFYRPACADAPPAPLIYFHGTDDKVVPYEGGSVAGSPRGSITRRVAPVDQTMADWANHNGCSPEPTTTEIGDTTNIVWGNCTANATVDFYRVNDGGHTWPGTGDLIAAFTERSLGRTTQAVKATDLMWEFFKQYQLTPGN